MKSAIVPALALLLCGCAGYKLGPGKPHAMQGVNTIAVPVFKNNTLIPRIEVLTTNSLIKQFQTDGTYEIASEDSADAIVEGTIVSIERRSDRSLRGNVLASTEFDMDLKIAYTVTQRATGKLLTKGEATGSTSFFVGNDVQQDQRQAMPLAAEKAAVQIVSLISEGWQKSDSER
jgi:hypothetical protein